MSTEIESAVSNPFSYVFRWIGVNDRRTCPKCRRLIGRTWRDQDLFQNILWDPFEGDIFDLDRGVSLAHGRGPHRCRCGVIVDVYFDITKTKLYHTIQKIKDATAALKGLPE